MELSLDTGAQRLIEERVRSGKYGTAEDVVTAALHALEHDEQLGDFAEGELDALIAEGEASGPALDGEAVLAEFRELRDRHRHGNSK